MIEATILRHQTALAVLETQQRELEMKLSLVIYPVLSLPTEITSRIFVACLPSDGFVRPSPSEPPLTLAQVCSLWRDIALSTCRLWGSLSFRFTTKIPLSMSVIRGVQLLFEKWISRAKGCPLSLSLISSHKALPEEILSLIPSVSSQLYRLDIRLSSADFDSLRQNTISFPRLQHLVINLYKSWTHAPASYISIVKSAPTLRDLEVGGGVPPSVSNLQRYPFLNTIELEIHSVQTLVDILNLLPRLLHLKANLNDLVDGSQPMTTAPSLQSLTLFGDATPAILDFLKLPGLCRLELRAHSISYSTLTAFLARSSCTLEHLAIVDCGGDDPTELIQYLRAIPSLTSLDIDVNVDFPAVVEQMAVQPPILPRLCTLTFRGLCRRYLNDTPDHNYLPLLDLLRVRRNPSDPNATKLSSFQLYVEENPYGYDWLRDDMILAKFSQLIAQGLKVELTYSNGSQWPLT
ncbi:hypothetical protein C8R44DRAFT_677317 [Mycena epipterygia]|nr:hypothetical protein C8R44DRAFT_677317 [Mycena epipterygia]